MGSSACVACGGWGWGGCQGESQERSSALGRSAGSFGASEGGKQIQCTGGLNLKTPKEKQLTKPFVRRRTLVHYYWRVYKCPQTGGSDKNVGLFMIETLLEFPYAINLCYNQFKAKLQ